MTSKEAFEKYGRPCSDNEPKYMIVWKVNSLYRKFIPCLPEKIYINKDFKPIVSEALNKVIEKGLSEYIYSWDGCFNVRMKRGANHYSMHSWGLAIDINTKGNEMGQMPLINKEVVQCFKEAGANWGGDWQIPDGMHFEIK